MLLTSCKNGPTAAVTEPCPPVMDEMKAEWKELYPVAGPYMRWWMGDIIQMCLRQETRFEESLNL